jgi:DNA-binding response OmpR family regulator
MKFETSAAASTQALLVVDADPMTLSLFKGAAEREGAGTSVRAAMSANDALLAMKHRLPDVVMINLQIDDNSGLALLETVRRIYPTADVVALSRLRRNELTLDAFRAGATDVLFLPASGTEVESLLTRVWARRNAAAKTAYRHLRLRRVCKQLNKARHEIRQQVDLLCNDLVRAYQDMAVQLNAAQVAADYAGAVGQELEVEGLLRKTMEWILKKLGPVNAAIYLPDSERHFALGAYLNLDTDADAPLISAIGDTIVKQADTAARPVAAEDDQALEELFGEEGRRLKGRAWLAAPCVPTGGTGSKEAMAVLVIFRKQTDAQGDTLTAALVETVAPVLGDKIQQALGLYHRLHPYFEENDEGGGYESA